MPNTDSKSTSDNQQTQSPQTDPYIPPYPQQIVDDTIDLYELWIILWNKKWLVIAVTAISVLGSVVYLVRQPFIYKAEALLLPPKAKDIQSLNVQGVHEKGLSPVLQTSSKRVFEAFNKNLLSRRIQKKFIEDQNLMDILAPGRTPETRDIEILESFSKMIKIENGIGMSVSMESDDPEFAANLVNDYISFLDAETILAMSATARNSLAGQIRDIVHYRFQTSDGKTASGRHYIAS